MNSNIIHREIIVLPEKQLQMLRSGWGSAAIDNTIVESIVYLSDGYEVQGYIAYPREVTESQSHEVTTEEVTESRSHKGTSPLTPRPEVTESQSHRVTTSPLTPLLKGEGNRSESTDQDSLTSLPPKQNFVTSPNGNTKNSLPSDQTSNINLPSPSRRGVGGEVGSGSEVGALPCIIWNRGGSKERGAIDKFTARGMFGQLASWGFVVFASSYRASFNNELHDEFGGSDVDDILNLMEIAKEIPFADTSRWAMEGWSRGGMMTYLALRKRHDVKVAIISGGITDVAECCLNVPRIREALQQLVEIEGIGVYEKRSAIHFADELPKDCKYLIIHGTKDETVSPLQAIKIAEKLLEQRLHFRLVLLEEADHFLKGKKKIVDELRREWLLKYV